MAAGLFAYFGCELYSVCLCAHTPGCGQCSSPAVRIPGDPRKDRGPADGALSPGAHLVITYSQHVLPGREHHQLVRNPYGGLQVFIQPETSINRTQGYVHIDKQGIIRSQNVRTILPPYQAIPLHEKLIPLLICTSTNLGQLGVHVLAVNESRRGPALRPQLRHCLLYTSPSPRDS